MRAKASRKITIPSKEIYPRRGRISKGRVNLNALLVSVSTISSPNSQLTPIVKIVTVDKGISACLSVSAKKNAPSERKDAIAKRTNAVQQIASVSVTTKNVTLYCAKTASQGMHAKTIRFFASHSRRCRQVDQQ